MNKLWFTSDLHFSHKNIVKFTDRGVATTPEEHDQWLEDLWNSTVHPSDIVYHLGDFSFNKDVAKTVALLNRLKGNKVLLKGNHDHTDAFEAYGKAKAKSVQLHMYLEKKIRMPSNVQDGHLVMFHFPIGSWHKQSYGSWHLHGHSHGNYQQGQGKILDVGLDNAYNTTGKHQFFDLDMIAEYMQKREVFIADTHRGNY